ncbi:glycogen/starch synthase [Desulfococcaceae bacterium HSG9]|nr:glycogen/starch synthase [Desulfococcaceae bacterium HSG9]
MISNSGSSNNPRILIVTPEITYLPQGMGTDSEFLNAKAGGLADVSAALIQALYSQGADVHIAIPYYRSLFNGHSNPIVRKKLNQINKDGDERIHFAQDRAFFYRDQVYSGVQSENIKIALAFQREVINNIVPRVRPDLIHCNDWMTGLIPAMAQQSGIPCLFTIHNIHTVKCLLSEIEDRGIDCASFWRNLFYDSFPSGYEEIHNSIPTDFLTSGVFAGHFVNTVSQTFLDEIIAGRHGFVDDTLRQELNNKNRAGCTAGIPNAPDPSYNPSEDETLPCSYSPMNHTFAKKLNKRVLQKKTGLIQDTQAPIFFWPSRLDPVQKGCQLLAEILYTVIDRYWEEKLQIVFVADGEFETHFRNIINFHNLSDRVALCAFDERLARMAYGAADFVLMPSGFEPCGLPQMIGAIYGALPVAHDTGGIHDTVADLDLSNDTGNGFLFKNFDKNGLAYAIDQAMRFYKRPVYEKERQIRRIMEQSASQFNHSVTAQQYIELYEKMMERPLITPDKTEIHRIKKVFVKTASDTRNLPGQITLPHKNLINKGERSAAREHAIGQEAKSYG